MKKEKNEDSKIVLEESDNPGKFNERNNGATSFKISVENFEHEPKKREKITDESPRSSFYSKLQRVEEVSSARLKTSPYKEIYGTFESGEPFAQKTAFPDLEVELKKDIKVTEDHMKTKSNVVAKVGGNNEKGDE